MKKVEKIKVSVYLLSKRADVDLTILLDDGDNAHDVAVHKAIEMAEKGMLSFIDVEAGYIALPVQEEPRLLN